MKIDTVYFLGAIAVGLLLSYGLWSIADAHSSKLSAFIATGSVVYLCSTLGLALGVRHENPRTRTNLSVLSGLFFIIGLGINLTFCFAGNMPAIYLIVAAISFLTYLMLVNFIANARQ